MEKYQKKAGPVKVAAPVPKTKPVQAGKSAVSPVKTVDFAFSKENYRLMLIGLALMALGFILMIGGGSKDPNDFSPDIFNFQRLTLAPVLILSGYVVEIFAIMKKPKD
jgi:hypothetical protein